MSLYCRMLYIFLDNEVKPNNNVLTVDQLCHLMSTKEATEKYYLPQEQEEIVKTLSSLHSTGLITILKNDLTPGNSWVVIDRKTLLDEVNRTLFSLDNFKHKSSNAGIITQSVLTQIIPCYDSEMQIQFLCYMKLCMEITPDMLVYSNMESKPQNDSNNVEDKLLFIPALIRNVQRPAHKMSEKIQFGWCLQCSNSHQFFLPRFLHTLHLHLAYQYALPKTAGNPHHRRCTIWTDGILWSDNEGVQTLVEIVDNSQCVLLLMSCVNGYERNMVKLRMEVIKDILSDQKDTCPRLELQEFIIDPSQLDYPIDKPSSLTLYDIEHIASCVLLKKPFIISYKNTGERGIKVSDLLPYEPINSALSVFAGRNPETLVPDAYRRSRGQRRVQDYDVLAQHALVPDDLPDIMKDIHDLRPDYEQLGTYLRLRESDIEAIKMDNHHNVWICLKNVISMWLNRNTTATELPNRRLLVEAIERINPCLAITLGEKYAA